MEITMAGKEQFPRGARFMWLEWPRDEGGGKGVDGERSQGEEQPLFLGCFRVTSFSLT